MNLSCFTKLFSESDRDAIIELSRNISLGSIGLAFAAGGFYFAGVMCAHVHGAITIMLMPWSHFGAKKHHLPVFHLEFINRAGIHAIVAITK